MDIHVIVLMSYSISRLHQSRTQSPQALWPAVGHQERLWGTGILFKFSDWLVRNLSLTAPIVLPQNSCGNKIQEPRVTPGN